MPEKALVTGGSGYFGSLLLRKLQERGLSCRVFDINDASDRSPDVEFFQGDVRDYASIEKACKGITRLYHNVAQVPLAKDRNLFDTVNIHGTENVLKAASRNGVGKMIYTSSSAVYGAPKALPVTEATPPSPAEAYGAAKLQGEKLCQDYSEKGLDISIIRPRTILGHGRLGIFQILFEWIREGANIPVLGDGNNIYQFVHADDLAEVCILASMRHGSSVYNCGTDRYGTMREVLEALCQHAKTGSRVKSVPMNLATLGMNVTSAFGFSPLGAYHALMYGRSMYFDIQKARNELHWQPRYSNTEMFIESYEWYLSHRADVLASARASHHRSAVKQGVLSLVKYFL